MSSTSKTWDAGIERSSCAGTTPGFDAFAWRAQGTILVVDDDEAVRELVVDTLSRTGLKVICAVDGSQGIELFRRRADEIRAVMLDRTMPLTSGEQALVQMQQIRPEVPILLVSGYSQRSMASEIAGRARFLRKPFTPETLIDNIRGMLEAA